MINKYSILKGAKYSSPGIFQNYLVFISAIKHAKYFHGTTQIYSWKSYGMSDSLPDINFNRHCLIKNNIFIPKNVINLYISYTLLILHYVIADLDL